MSSRSYYDGLCVLVNRFLILHERLVDDSHPWSRDQLKKRRQGGDRDRQGPEAKPEHRGVRSHCWTVDLLAGCWWKTNRGVLTRRAFVIRDPGSALLRWLYQGSTLRRSGQQMALVDYICLLREKTVTWLDGYFMLPASS